MVEEMIKPKSDKNLNIGVFSPSKNKVRSSSLKSNTSEISKDELKNKDKPKDECPTLHKLIQVCKEGKSPYLKYVESVDLLKKSLEFLRDELIGLNTVKESIALQTMQLMISMYEDKNRKDDRPIPPKMLHTTIYGESGTAKSTVAKCLARIWQSLGYLKKKNTTSSSPTEHKSLETHQETIALLSVLVMAIPIIKFMMEMVGVKWTLLISALVVLFYFMSISKKAKANSDVVSVLPKDDNDIFKVVSREDLVAGYLGQTSLRCKKVLEENTGKVLFIDEAYSLYTGDRDTFGAECLNTLNLYMSEHPDLVIVVFAGYKEALQNSIFACQKGLIDRCQWYFEMPAYSQEELFKIFELQVKKSKWSLPWSEMNNLPLVNKKLIKERKRALKMFIEYADDFSSYARSTQRVVEFAIIDANQSKFHSSSLDDPSINKNFDNKVLSLKNIEKGLIQLKNNNIIKSKPEKPNWNELIKKMVN